MFENLTRKDEIKDDSDSFGSNLINSGIYPATIELAYIEKSKKGSTGIVMQFKLDNGRFYNQTFWVVSRKSGDHTWTDAKGRKGYIPGFTCFDELSVVTLGTHMAENDAPERKTINVYDFTVGKEKPTEKDVYTQLIGKKCQIGILSLMEDHYLESTSWQEKNDINKVFAATGASANEVEAGADDSYVPTKDSTHGKWLQKFEGKTIDKRKASTKGNQFVYKESTNTSTEQTAASKTPSLFGNGPTK